jgi:hypothetical protein
VGFSESAFGSVLLLYGLQTETPADSSTFFSLYLGQHRQKETKNKLQAGVSRSAAHTVNFFLITIQKLSKFVLQI